MSLHRRNSVICLGCCVVVLTGAVWLFSRGNTGRPAGDISQPGVSSEEQLRGEGPGLRTDSEAGSSSAEEDKREDTWADIEASDTFNKDPSLVQNMEWDSREITADFTDRERIDEVVGRMPVSGETIVTEKQLKRLRGAVVELVFDNGNSDYASYFDFLKESGEIVAPDIHGYFLKERRARSIPGDNIPADPWRLLKEEFQVEESRWKGFVSEGSEISVHQTGTASMVKPGKELEVLRGAITTYHHISTPPISFEAMLEQKGTLSIADVKIFVAHDDGMGGIVRPYIVRYWLDPTSEIWRPLFAVAFQDRRELFEGYLMP